MVDFERGSIAVAHNGNLVNAHTLRRSLDVEGSIFQSTMDTEVIVHLIAKSRMEGVEDRIVDALSKVRGAYSLLFLTRDRLIAGEFAEIVFERQIRKFFHREPDWWKLG